MTQDDIIRMAEAAGFPARRAFSDLSDLYPRLERFAALIEQHLSYDGIHTCHDECQRPACVAVREAVKAEREVCAEMVAGMDVQHPKYIAAAIRARGEK
jgi:hypothetical protein